MTTEDIYLMFALKVKIQTKWAKLICDSIMKVIFLPIYQLPYGLILSKVFEYYKVDLTDEVCMDLNHTNIIKENALHHMGIFLFDKE